MRKTSKQPISRLSRRVRRGISSMNPVYVWMKNHGLSVGELAKYLGVSSSYISDVIYCRKPNPVTFLDSFAEKTGIDPAELKAKFQRNVAQFQEMEDLSVLYEIEDSNVFKVPPAPPNPMRLLLDRIGATPEQLARQLKGASVVAIQSILDNKASAEKASQVFLAIAYEKPVYMTQARINSSAEALYRSCLEYEERKAKAEENTQRANSWVRNAWIERSQPRADLVEPIE